MVRTKERVKRGNGEKPIYLDDNRDDKPQIQIECKENAYDTVDLLDWLEQIKPTLSNNEYKYIKLMIIEPHSYKMTNVEIGQELNVKEGAIRHIRKHLKSNKHLIALLHK